MSDTMQAVVNHGPKDYRLETLPVPSPGPGEALVRVEAVGICASDLKCYDGAAKFWGDDTRPAWAETQVTPGHEFVGRIVEIDHAAAQRWGVATGSPRSRSSPAGRAGTAGAASTGCAPPTTSTGSNAAPRARWPST